MSRKRTRRRSRGFAGIFPVVTRVGVVTAQLLLFELMLLENPGVRVSRPESPALSGSRGRIGRSLAESEVLSGRPGPLPESSLWATRMPSWTSRDSEARTRRPS